MIRQTSRKYASAWEQRKLGEIADKVTEKNLDGNITEVLTNSAEYGVINQTEFFDTLSPRNPTLLVIMSLLQGISCTTLASPQQRLLAQSVGIRWEYTELCLLSTLYSGLQMQSMELISATSSRQMAGMVS